MSNSIWDWWYGDGPLRYQRTPAAMANPTTVRSLTLNQSQRWLSWIHRFVNRRRFLVLVAVVGSASFAAQSPLRADESETDLKVMNASFGWAPAATFAMIIADEEGVNEKTSTAKVAASKDAAKQAAGDQKETLDEDEQRRKRLRDLLGEDDDPTDSDDGDQPQSENDKSQDMDEDDDGAKGLFADPFIETRLPEIEGGRFVLPPLRAVSIDQKPIGNGKVPDALNAGDELNLVALPEDGYARITLSQEAAWPSLIRPWAAPNTYSHPLYFEDRMLERHGHERWGCWQPLASGTRFFATLPMLPYLATVQEPCDIVYSKGYYRAGSPAPALYQRPPLERRAVIVEAAVVSGTFIALP